MYVQAEIKMALLNGTMMRIESEDDIPKRLNIANTQFLMCPTSNLNKDDIIELKNVGLKTEDDISIRWNKCG